MSATASAPASSGNLGPGFDTLALALSLRCSATAEIADSMTLSERGSTVRLVESDLIHRAVDMAVGRPMHITLANEIPRARGLGSSSAVVASCAQAAMRATRVDGGRHRVFEIVADLDGHADNAGATVYGGLVATTFGGVKQLRLDESLLVVLGVPNVELRTVDSRRALPASVPRDVATRTIARVSFLLAGLADGDAEALARAAGDEMHEQPRAALSPITASLVAAAMAAGAAHACWSGAGPTALAFVTSASRDPVIGAMERVLGTAGEVLALEPDYEGVI